MDHTTFRRWLDDYVDAWRTYDEEAIGALFSTDASYRYHPWDERDDAVQGRDAIVASWLADRDDPNSWEAEYRPWAIEGDRGGSPGYVALSGRRRRCGRSRVPQRIPLPLR